MLRRRVAILGVGAVGGSLAAELRGHELTLCARRSSPRLIVEEGPRRVQVDAPILCEPSEGTPVDWLLLATKAYQVASTRPWFEALCSDSTRIAVVQNGVEQAERVAGLAPRSCAVLPVVIEACSERVAPGHVRRGHAGRLFVPEGELAREFAGLFEGARARVSLEPEFDARAWRKLALNAALGGTCAVLEAPNGVARDPAVFERVRALLEEVVAVARAVGVSLQPGPLVAYLREVVEGEPEHWPSIALDRREGRPMEWRVRNEVVSRLARHHGVEAPLSDALCEELRALDEERSA